jgi:hypothetical protein
MTTTPSPDTANGPGDDALTYQVTVAGHLDDHWSGWLGGQSLVRDDDSTTTLILENADQAQLHGFLAGIRDLGVTLLSLRTVDDTPADEAVPEPVQTHRLDTERLTLRPAAEADADATWTYRRRDSDAST